MKTTAVTPSFHLVIFVTFRDVSPLCSFSLNSCIILKYRIQIFIFIVTKKEHIFFNFCLFAFGKWCFLFFLAFVFDLWCRWDTITFTIGTIAFAIAAVVAVTITAFFWGAFAFYVLCFWNARCDGEGISYHWLFIGTDQFYIVLWSSGFRPWSNNGCVGSSWFVSICLDGLCFCDTWFSLWTFRSLISWRRFTRDARLILSQGCSFWYTRWFSR